MYVKKLSKKITTVAAVAAVVSSMALSASAAADYGNQPQYANPPILTNNGTPRNVQQPPKLDGDNNNTENPLETGTGTLISAKEVAELVQQAIASGEDNVEITLTTDAKGNIVIPEEAIAAFKEVGISVTINVVNADGTSYQVTISPDDVDGVDKLNLGLKITKLKRTSKLRGDKLNKNAVVIQPKAKGDFGGTFYVSIPAALLTGMNVDGIKLYQIDSLGNLTEVEDGLYIDEETGNATIALSSGDPLVLSDKNLVKANSDAAKSGARQGKTAGAAALGSLSVAAALTKKKRK